MKWKPAGKNDGVANDDINLESYYQAVSAKKKVFILHFSLLYEGVLPCKLLKNITITGRIWSI